MRYSRMKRPQPRKQEGRKPRRKEEYMNHKHGVTSNTQECFRTFIGCRVRGFLKNALPVGRCDLAGGTKTLIFECGWGLTIAKNGSYWTESPEDIARAVEIAKRELADIKGDIEDALKVAGAQP